MEAFEKLVLMTMEELAVAPFDRGAIEAAFQQVAYRYREINNYYPLTRLFAVKSSWALRQRPTGVPADGPATRHSPGTLCGKTRLLHYRPARAPAA